MIIKEFKFENGQPVKEKVTGFKGTITGTCFYLTGCTQHLVTAKSKEGKEPIAIWYDEGRLELMEDKPTFTEKDVESQDNGCDLLPNVGLKNQLTNNQNNAMRALDTLGEYARHQRG